MGFFRHTDGATSYIDTDKLCQDCYNKAVPNLAVWTTYYKPSERPMEPAHRDRLRASMLTSEEWSQRHGADATLPPLQNTGWQALRNPASDDFYPPMMESGTEDAPDAPVRSGIRMPVNAEAHEAFRLMQENGAPFYIDQLHLTQPWDPNAPDQQAEDRRVAAENRRAYESATVGILGTGVGGGGVNSIVEQRILRDRIQELPGRFGSPSASQRQDDYTLTDEYDHTPQPRQPGRDVGSAPLQPKPAFGQL